MIDAERERLIELVAEMRHVAAQAGSMHGWWDTIFDVESALAGGPAIVNKTPREWIEYCESLLTGRGH